jgi:membrane protein
VTSRWPAPSDPLTDSTHSGRVVEGMPSLKQRVTGRLDRTRQRRPALDHALRTVTHYGSVGGNAQAGAVTFFGFLSFFPILALAFFVVGIVAHVYPDLRGDVHRTINDLLPGVIGSDKGEIPMRTFEKAAGTVGTIGVIGVLYSGLGWLSGMREALEVMFVTPRREQPNLVVGKARDLGTLVLIGLTLLTSVALSAAVSGFSSAILRWVGIDPEGAVPQAVLWLVGHALAVVATSVLLSVMFGLLADPRMPRRSLLEGALLGAVGFEILKMVANFLLGQTKGQPAFQAFGVALILVVWINYFSRLVMYAAAYAYTSREAAAQRAREAMIAPGAALSGTTDAGTASGPGSDEAGPVTPVDGEPRRPAVLAAGLLGLAAVGALAAWQRKERA